jgi:hypothetical protein
VAHPVPVHPARQIHEWAYRNRPLAEEQKESNWQKLKIRARIAHVFGSMSQSMKGFYLRSIGRRWHAPLPDARFHPTHP